MIFKVVVDIADSAITAGATLAGVAAGSIITWRLSIGQRKHNEMVRREERQYERLVAASLWLRRGVIAAADLDYSKSWRGTVLDIKVWGPRWRPFLEAIAEAGAALSLLRGVIDERLVSSYLAAADELVSAKGSDHDKLQAYMKTADALRSRVDEIARPYAKSK